MAIVLFTDFGSNDLYVGQIEAVLDRYAPGVRVIHLLHEAPSFNVKASAHLLAALSTRIPKGHVFMGVVDPGVGSDRGAVVMRADGRWFIGPDNGLFSVLAARSTARQFWQITSAPARLAPSFHGRDLFAPMAASVVTDDFPNSNVRATSGLQVSLGAGDLAEVAYIDHYGNAFTGIRAADICSEARVAVSGREVPHARVFSAVAPGEVVWYENSIGLVEIAVNQGSAADQLGLAVGDAVVIVSG
ncbi:MAG: SAM-dependent chlorinase/fluorinase [Burkholderiales bacterium]